MRFHFKRVSGNRKLGGIPAVMSSEDTCPRSCPFRGSGCYAERGRIRIHWRKLKRRQLGTSLAKVCKDIKRLPYGSIWRYATAGDLPGKWGRISAPGLRALVEANRGRKGWTYTHKPWSKRNLDLIREANARGFTVNLSTEGLQHADRGAALGLPVVCVLPEDFKRGDRTPEGRAVIGCPEETTPGMDCAHCGICQKKDRTFIVGFYARGSGARMVRAIATKADTQKRRKSV